MTDTQTRQTKALDRGAPKQTVIVTGAARGLGRALVEAFLNDGLFVCGITRSEESATELTSIFGSTNFLALAADVADYDQVARAFEQILSKTGGIDFLFNNAAVYPKTNFVEESAEDWMNTIRVNLGGASNCCKAILPSMIKAGRGRIFNVGSWADIDPLGNSSAYSVSKGGLHALTRSIAKDLETLNLDIEVHEWIPGHLNTRMSDFTGIEPSISAQWGVVIAHTPASRKSTIFENDRERVPPKRLKEKILDRLFFWR